ncbi:MAG: ABC transporter substrate-binding protein [Candidatus Omnitrophota bacterium]
MVLATTSDPRSFNPIVAQETSTTAITSHIFEGLTRTNGVTLKVEPHLAQSWDISPDGLLWTFHLRSGVVWSDGVSFSADDVVFTFNDLIYNEKIPTSARDAFTIDGKIFKVEKIDDLTVKFTLPFKFAPFLRGMSQEILPKHRLERIVQENKFNFALGIDSDLKDIVGTGPYQLTEYLPGQRIILKKNHLYWRKSLEGEQLPFIEKIIYMIVQSQDTLLLKFLDGEVDYCSLRGADYPLLKPEEKKKNFTIYDSGPDFGSNFIVFNQNDGINPKTKKMFVDPKKLSWFANREFRRAVAHAIDKKRIIDIVMNGLGYPQDSAESPSAEFFYNPKVIGYDYDLAKAREILEKSGFTDRNGDGIVEDKNGYRVEFNLYTNSGSTDRVQMAAMIRHDLENLGMKVNLVSIEFNDLVSRLVSTYDWDAVMIGLTGGIEPHFGKNVWASDGQLHVWYPRQEQPQSAWEKRVDDIFNQAVQELDEPKRKVLYDEWQLIVSRELPAIYTVFGANIFAVRNKFENLHPTSFGGAFHNLEEIFIKEEYR